MASLAAAAAATAACSSSAVFCSEAFRARCNAAASASPAFPSLFRSRSSRLAAVRASSRLAPAEASAAAEEKSSGEAARGQTVAASQKVASSAASVLSSSALLQLTALVAPALAVYEAPAGLTDDQWVEAAIYFVLIFGGYLFVAPPLIYNYLRVRWYNRSMPETFFQYWLMFTFFPGMLLWAPFINFRRFPRDSV